MANELAVNSLGMLFIGFTLATWLFGANTLQTYVYFQRYDDGFLLKAVVVIVFFSDVLNTIFTCWGIYMELVQTPILPLQGNIPLVLESTASDIAIFIVQCFLAQSVYQVSRHNRWLTVLIITLATLAFAFGIVLTTLSITAIYLAGKSLPMLNELCVGIALGLVTLTDIIITVSLIGYLYDGKSSSGPTSKLFDKLIFYCVQRSFLTTISHVIVLALWFALPTNWAWTLFQFSLGKVYTLTFLTLLNRRESLKQVDYRMHEYFDPELQPPTHAVPMTYRDNETDEDKSELAVVSAA